MDAPAAFMVLSLERHDPRCANSNQPPNYEPSRPGPALRRRFPRLMTAGPTQTLASPDPHAPLAECHNRENNDGLVDAALHSLANVLDKGPLPVDMGFNQPVFVIQRKQITC